MTNNELVAENNVQHDNSGVGHNWQTTNDLPADIAEEIACWIIEDDPAAGDEYQATDGHTYRLPPE